MFVNHHAFEEAKRHQQVTVYDVIPRQSSEQEDYQVLVEDIPSVFKDDLRVIQNKKEADFWIEEKAKAWVKISKLLVNTPQQLFALSGNPSASSASDFTATMITPLSNPSFHTRGSFEPSTYNTEHNPGNTLVRDDVYGYIETHDEWMSDDEGCYWQFDFGSSAPRRFYVKWYGSATEDPWYDINFTISIYISPDGSTWTEIDSHHFFSGGSTSVTITNYNGTYRYVKVDQYSTTDEAVNDGYTYVDAVWARKYTTPEPLILKKRTGGKADALKAIVCGNAA